MRLVRRWSVLVGALVIGGCGGGGGDAAPSPASKPSIEGFWGDANSVSLITQTGELWSVEQTASGPKLTKGTVTTTGNAFTGTLTTYDGLLSASGTVNGAFVENKSLNGTSNISGATGTFAMTYQANYATAPTLIARGGTYKMTGGTVVLATNGSIAGSRGGCSFTGQLTPDASGKNFYRLSLTFGASPCVLPAASATGVAVVDDVSVVAGYVSGGAGEAIYATK